MDSSWRFFLGKDHQLTSRTQRNFLLAVLSAHLAESICPPTPLPPGTCTCCVQGPPAGSLSWVGLGTCTHPEHVHIHYGNICDLGQQRRRRPFISIPAKKLLIFYLGKACVLYGLRAGSSPYPLIAKAWVLFRSCSCGLQLCKHFWHHRRTSRRLYSTR